MDQGIFCFLAAAVIPPDACTDVTGIAGVTSLAISITLVGELLFKVPEMSNIPDRG